MELQSVLKGVPGGGIYSTLAEFYSMADSSTTAAGIPIRIAGGCWAGC